MYHAQSYAEPTVITTEDVALDGYARRGVALTRDAASVVIAALKRDAYEMRERGGRPNLDAAATNDALADAIVKAVR